jgi:5-formyltetrahydrofolate cyclo-ligase
MLAVFGHNSTAPSGKLAASQSLLIVICVAVTRAGGRTGKGGGFADLELGIFRELGKVKPGAPIVTTVHALQVVDDDRIVMLGHDSALDWIITPDDVIEIRTQYAQPTGMDWDIVQPDQYKNIPFLTEGRSKMQLTYQCSSELASNWKIFPGRFPE